MFGLTKHTIFASSKALLLTLIFIGFSFLCFSQAALPLSRTSWDAAAPTGWTDSGAGSYTSSFACSGNNAGKLDDSGDYYEVNFSDAPDELTFVLKGASFSGGTFSVLESADGSSWSTLATFTSIAGSCNTHIYTLDCATRYVRFNYDNKSSGNVSLDDVSITTGTPCSPCSGCSIDDAGLANIGCDNNGTTADTADDIITFDLNPTGCDLSATYNVSVSAGTISPSSGISYGSTTSFTMNTGSAGAGDVTVTITDASGGGCTLDAVVTDPGECSTVSTYTGAEGVIVNEYSNGDSGTKEYYELLVIGEPCGTVDIRGWIFDDNNGPDDATCEGFTDNTGTSSGIAGGHNRFAYISRWAAVPVGSLILIYNDGDKNAAITLADDPTDANSDLVYVLPISDAGLEGNGTTPVDGGTCGYSGGSYGAASWNYIGLRNSGDACQTRMPDGTYFHGFAYGSNLTGGPDNLYFSGSGTDKNYYLNCGHHSFITDYSEGDGDISDGSSDETPGAVNNSLNQEIIDYYRGTNGCGVADACVVVLSSKNVKLSGKTNSGQNKLMWRIDDFNAVERFIIEKSENGTSFEPIQHLENNYANIYKAIDNDPYAITYYRILVKTKDGENHTSNTIVLNNNSKTKTFTVSNLHPNPANNQFSFDLSINQRGTDVVFNIYNMLGAMVEQQVITGNKTIFVNSSDFQNGIYTLVFSTESEHYTHKLIIQK